MSAPSNLVTLSVASEQNLNEKLVAFIKANYPEVLLDVAIGDMIRFQEVGDSMTAEWVLAPANAAVSASGRTEGDDTLAFDAWNPTSVTMLLVNCVAAKAMSYDEWHSAARSLGEPLSNLMDSAIQDILDVRERIFFAAATGNTNTYGNTALTLTGAELRAAAWTLKGLSAKGRMIFTGHTSQARDILESYATSNASALVGRGGVEISPEGGYVITTLEGVEVYQSANGLANAPGRNGLLFVPGGMGVYQRRYADGGIFRAALSTPQASPGSIFDHRDQIALSVFTAIAVDAVDQNKVVQVTSRG